MIPIAPQLQLAMQAIIFAAAVFLHLTKKNSSAVRLYIAQSSAISLLLVLPAFEESSWLLVVAIVSTVAVKIFISQISVETYKGIVQLSGFVNSQQAVNKAGEIVRSVKGVKSITNNLSVK